LVLGKSNAQTDTIHGVINRYTRVTYIECTNNSAIQVENPHGFKAGDRVLIIQMQGAVIDQRDTSSFGSITANNNAGNYELATVDEVHGYTFILHYELARTYTLSGIVQVVRVPSYTNVVISDTLKPKAWDGSTGGILALIASGTVTMNADMNAVGCGFREGIAYGSALLDTSLKIYEGIVTISDDTSAYYCSALSDSGALKGEGIHIAQRSYLGGKGALANAGGGGNAAQFGAGAGGGGGNYGRGGNGGGGFPDANATGYAGIGGYGLDYSNVLKRVYMGGSGGWGGHDPDKHKGSGRAGGGIIFVRANQIDGNGHYIRSDGADTAALFPGLSYPGGGGGAGGVVLLDVGSFTDTVRVSAKGGKGQSMAECDATGGGGGGGCIWLSGSTATPAYLVSDVSGGAAGVKNGGSCTGPTLRDGFPGASGGVLTDLQIPEGTIPR
jgi:hypothetical protein